MSVGAGAADGAAELVGPLGSLAVGDPEDSVDPVGVALSLPHDEASMTTATLSSMAVRGV